MTVLLHYVYILKCLDGTYYTGYTTDVKRRVKEHNAGTVGAGARYTSSRRPVTLQHTESFDSRSEAQAREYAIKQLTRAQKKELILAARRKSRK